MCVWMGSFLYVWAAICRTGTSAASAANSASVTWTPPPSTTDPTARSIAGGSRIYCTAGRGSSSVLSLHLLAGLLGFHPPLAFSISWYCRSPRSSSISCISLYLLGQKKVILLLSFSHSCIFWVVLHALPQSTCRYFGSSSIFGVILPSITHFIFWVILNFWRHPSSNNPLPPSARRFSG